MCERASKAFNRFMGFLSSKLAVGFRPDYLKSLEPQDFGNPHFHVVLFGVKRMMNNYELARRLREIGFGKIHYEYVIVKDGNGNWV